MRPPDVLVAFFVDRPSHYSPPRGRSLRRCGFASVGCVGRLAVALWPLILASGYAVFAFDVSHPPAQVFLCHLIGSSAVALDPDNRSAPAPFLSAPADDTKGRRRPGLAHSRGAEVSRVLASGHTRPQVCRRVPRQARNDVADRTPAVSLTRASAPGAILVPARC
jgi:hypothetical protein